MFRRLVSLRKADHLLASGFGSGLIPFAPGTCASLVALSLGAPLLFHSNYLVALILLAIPIGIWVCHRTARDLGETDPAVIVYDEFVGMWITLLGLSSISLAGCFMAFLLFRLLDIFKPWPIRSIEAHFAGGLGIMLDDILAGAIAAIMLRLLF